MPAFAHSLKDRPESVWEPLDPHLAAVGDGAAKRAAFFGWGEVGRAAGMLHDIGKASAEFLAYIRGEGSSPDHSTAGALEACKLYPGAIGGLLAFCIAGHHAGLSDGVRLAERLAAAGTLPDYSDWRSYAAPPGLDPPASGPPLPDGPYKGFARAFLARMLFSCLVDADFVETERFYARHDGRDVEREGFSAIPVLAERLQAHMARIRREDTPVNSLRSRVLDHAVGKAGLAPGLFTLTVPTGGGKTLTSLAFALQHACRHELRRVVYVIPFTSIIEQTAEVFREALGDADVLEHHATFDWEAGLKKDRTPAEADAGEGRDGLAKLRRAAENWEAPIVVTTAVQFFESLFANRTGRCRKLHNLARSVIVLDEAQTLPLPLLRPCLAAIDELARNYGATVILCTATQPAVRMQDGFKGGLDIGTERELAPDPPSLYAQLKRVTLERRPEPTEDAAIAARFAATPQMLCIVNSRAHAHDLFSLIRDQPGATHLTTLMCPRHRRQVLERARVRLKAGEPVRLVATSLIEAGVDISFPEVWRASTGMDSVAQAAGRCNRNDELAREGRKGRVVVFDPTDDHKPPHSLRAFQQAAASVLRRHADPLALEAVLDYFGQLYWSKQGAGRDPFDAAKLEGETFPILQKIADHTARLLFPFESIARAFRLIDQVMEPVIVPWDDAAVETLERVKAMDRPLSADLRRLQHYVVPVPPKARAAWLAMGAVVRVNPALGDALVALPDLALYDAATGVLLNTPTYRLAEMNVF